MATPIGHALVGFAVYKTVSGPEDRRSGRGRTVALTLLAMIFAIGPDLDFVPGVFQGRPALYHQGLSHSVGFAVLAGAVGAVLFGRGASAPLWATIRKRFGLDMIAARDR